MMSADADTALILLADNGSSTAEDADQASAAHRC